MSITRISLQEKSSITYYEAYPYASAAAADAVTATTFNFVLQAFLYLLQN